MSGPIDQQNEDAFVARYLAPLSEGDPAALGLTDDAALLKPRDGYSFVVTCDTLIEGRHFLFDGLPELAAHAAHKALAVNVSDLAAKGATPRAYLMSLALPPGDFNIWIPAFVAALGNCQRLWGLSLIGGDTVRAPDRLAITITAIGEVPQAAMVTRAKARPGDAIYLSGTIGDATLGLALATSDPKTATWAERIGKKAISELIDRYQRPTPRTALIDPLRTGASSAIDVSDGFVRDLGRICTQSQAGAEIEAELVPISRPARKLIDAGQIVLSDLFIGGDDYEIIACVAKPDEPEFVRATKSANEPMTRIGVITHLGGLRVIDPHGNQMAFAKTGWDHLE